MQTKTEELTVEGKFNQVLLRNMDCYLINMCCKVDRKIKQSSQQMMTPHMKYFSQTNETVIMESEQMKVVLHGQVDLHLHGT